MPDIIAARGARGEIVRAVQRRLLESGFAWSAVDGDFGPKTQAAIQAFQKSRSLATTGEIDDATWSALTTDPLPSMRDRCLQITAAFEEHEYTLACGNWDGAGLTWGIIGFTLRGGEVGEIVLEIATRAPQVLREAFGNQADALLAVLRAPKKEQMRWADQISLGANKRRLAEPWTSGFARLGEASVVHQIQKAHADRDYFQPALETAKRYGLCSQLGVALAFDIHVQNGGIHAAERRQIQRDRAAHPLTREQDVRILIAHAVAANAQQARADVLSRKLTLAAGAGRVHGATYVLRNWGLDESPFVA